MWATLHLGSNCNSQATPHDNNLGVRDGISKTPCRCLLWQLRLSRLPQYGGDPARSAGGAGKGAAAQPQSIRSKGDSSRIQLANAWASPGALAPIAYFPTTTTRAYYLVSERLPITCPQVEEKAGEVVHKKGCRCRKSKCLKK